MADTYKTPSDALGDPDFQQSKPETQRDILRKLDKAGWGTKPDQEIDAFIKKVQPSWQRDAQQAATVAQEQQVQPPSSDKMTTFSKIVKPITSAVGQGMEALTQPLVPLARMLNGEGIVDAYSPESHMSIGHGGRAAQTRETAAAGVVPQTPWQAGAMASQMIPGVGAMGAAGRVAGAAAGAGALQGLLGEKGLAEGGGIEDAQKEALLGGAKGAGTQVVGNILGKLAGGAYRAPFTGRGERIANADAQNVLKTAESISPAFKGAGKNTSEAGTFIKGTPSVENAAGANMDKTLTALESGLLASTGKPYVSSALLTDAYKDILKSQMAKKLVHQDTMAGLRPNANGEFLPSQARDILKILREQMALNPDAAGHRNQEVLNRIVQQIEGGIPAAYKGLFTKSQGDYAKAMGLQEMLAQAFAPSGTGFKFSMKDLQTALASAPKLAEQLGPDNLAKLLRTASRGLSDKPGFVDKAAGNVSVPYPTVTGATVAALRNMLTRGKYIGQLPGTVPNAARAGLGVAATGAASAANRAQRED